MNSCVFLKNLISLGARSWLMHCGLRLLRPSPLALAPSLSSLFSRCTPFHVGVIAVFGHETAFWHEKARFGSPVKGISDKRPGRDFRTRSCGGRSVPERGSVAKIGPKMATKPRSGTIRHILTGVDFADLGFCCRRILFSVKNERISCQNSVSWPKTPYFFARKTEDIQCNRA